MTKLILLFNEVRRTFYPRWDATGEWRVQRKARLSEGYDTRARCNAETQTIEIGPKFVPTDDNEIRWLLAHEICHAVTNRYHAKAWQTRFLKVADQADILGQKKLAETIRRDIEMIRESVAPTVGLIRNSFEDLLNQQPDVTFEIALELVAERWCYTSDGLSKRYSKLVKYYSKAKREALLYGNLLKKHKMDRLY